MEKQELFCHACGKYVQFDVPETDGRLVVVCPNCKHEHCRVVENGIITEERWDSRNVGNGTVIYATGTASTATSFITTYTVSASSTSFTFMAQSWLDTTTAR